MPEEMTRKRRRLRFDLDVHSDESVPGAIARGVAGHHLVRLGYVLKEAGARKRAGLSQLGDPADLERLAQVIRCDAHLLTAQAGRRLIEPGERRLQHFIDFDGLVMPRSHLDLERRRISPMSLRASPHHRQAWLMTVLPFCPVTLERLVDTCPNCGSTLGWSTTSGIERCEACLKIIPPSAEPQLAEYLVEDYRLFASLLSLRPAERIEAVAAMPPRLSQLAPGELARLAMRCGLDCYDGSEKRAWQTRAGRVEPERLAETVARGIALLRSWPHGISSWAADRVAQASDETACRRDLKRRIGRIAWGDSGFSNQRGLLSEVFPDLEAPLKPGPLGADVTYTGREVDRMLPGFRTHAPMIRQLGLVPHRPSSKSGDLTTYLYSVPDIDAAAAQWNDSISISSIMDQLQLPLYAIEQFFEARLLERCDNALLAVILRRPLATASTFDVFLKRLLRSQSRRARPTDSLPIGHESRRIGGHAKPWSDIYEALISKDVAFWPLNGMSIEHLHVARGSLDTFIGAQAQRAQVTDPEMSTNDAAELLNIIPGNVRRLRAAGILSREIGTRAMKSPRLEVEALAAEYVSAAEMARRTRTTAEHVNNQLRNAGFESFHGLWKRSEVLNVLPLR